MRILPTPPPAAVPAANNLHPAPTAAINSLMASGTVLNATVLQHRGEHLYEMLSQRNHFLAHSQLPLQIGQKLTLQVNNTQQADQSIELRIIDTQKQQIQDNLRAALPRQQDAQPLLQRLQQILTPGTAAALPTDVIKASEQFLRQLPSAPQISQSAGLQQAVMLSGIFHEAALINGQPMPDLKTQLLQLWTILNSSSQSLSAQQQAQTLFLKQTQQTKGTAQSPLPGSLLPERVNIQGSQSSTVGLLLNQLMQDTEGLLSRLESHQLLHLQQRDNQHAQWFIDLPVRQTDDTDLLRMHIQRDQRQGDTEEDAIWSFSVSFDFAQTGPMLARVTLADELSIQLHAQLTHTITLMEAFKTGLQTTLAELTGQTVNIVVHQGMPHPDSLPRPLKQVFSETA